MITFILKLVLYALYFIFMIKLTGIFTGVILGIFLTIITHYIIKRGI